MDIVLLGMVNSRNTLLGSQLTLGLLHSTDLKSHFPCLKVQLKSDFKGIIFFNKIVLMNP